MKNSCRKSDVEFKTWMLNIKHEFWRRYNAIDIKITDTKAIANELNNYFANIGFKLTQQIPAVDTCRARKKPYPVVRGK